MAKKTTEESSAAMPIWETLVMVASFVLLWAWFLAHQAAKQANRDLALGWKIALGTALIALVVVMVRRLKRVKIALDEGHRMARGMHGMPFAPPDQAPKRKK